MGDVAENGTTILLSSHNLRELEDVCDHVGILHQGKVLLERSLSELQDSISKVQVLFEGAPPKELPELELLHRSNVGKMQTYIVRGDRETVLGHLSAYSPLYLEALPLTLEEIFIYELGGMHYENVLL
jgi:ABC-2 type transport system ATP-binding protein